MPLPSFEEVRDRKLVRWAVAYLAGAWLALQVVAVLGSTYGWPSGLLRAVPVVLAVGFIGALVLAWYHGERGAKKVGGVELGILAALLGLGGLGVMLVGPAEADDEPEPAAAAVLEPDLDQTALAVLPFESVGDSNGYFADGLTDELLNTLARVPGLKVTARTSAFAFKDADVPADSIGRALGVAHLVEGSVRRAGDRVRVSAQLVDAETGIRRWGQTYERELTDLFAVQAEIARTVAYELRGRIDLGTLAASGTDDPEAYALYLQARQVRFHRAGTAETWLGEAEQLLERALARDSTFAAAWAELAIVYSNQGTFGIDLEGVESGRRAARRALLLDPHEPTAHYLLGASALFDDGDAEAAVPHLERAFDANPNHALALGVYARALQQLGRRGEAFRAARRAAELDPLSTTVLVNAGFVYMTALEFELAAEAFRAALALNPDDAQGWAYLARALAFGGETIEAVEANERSVALDPRSLDVLKDAGYVHFVAGDVERAEVLLREALALAPDGGDVQASLLTTLANILTHRGEHAEALAALDWAAALAPENEARQALVRTARGIALARAGRRDEARQVQDSLAADAHYDRAAVAAALGDRDRAFRQLGRTVEAEDPYLFQIPTDPWFEPLHGDPRWVRLVARLKAPLAVRSPAG